MSVLNIDEDRPGELCQGCSKPVNWDCPVSQAEVVLGICGDFAPKLVSSLLVC